MVRRANKRLQRSESTRKILWVSTIYDEIMSLEELCYQIADCVTIPYETVVKLNSDAEISFDKK